MFNEDRTEQATPRKRQEAREKGQVAKSMEINAALGLLAALLACKWFGPSIIQHWREFAATRLLQVGQQTGLTPELVQAAFTDASLHFFRLVLPLMLLIMAVGVASNVLQTGFVFTTHTLKFDFARMNPQQGMARMFSVRSLTDLLTSIAKAAMLGGIIYAFFTQHGAALTNLVTLSDGQLGPTLAGLCLDLLLKGTVALLVIAVLDYLFQRWQFERSLRMTKQEVKEEQKRLEGDPQVKGRIRQRQRESARHRMMADMPKATVVLTNPTHCAVALRYEAGMDAPIIIAKGQRVNAQKIQEVAQQHRIPVIEHTPLARALFAACEIGDATPPERYEAVAEIIASVFARSGRGMAASSTHRSQQGVP